jgi:3-oxoacyl-[acyl-carrier protein] reductase
MDLQLSGRVAIVPAASMGLGFGCAEALALEGASVVITGRRPEPLQAAAARIRARTKAEVIALDGDITAAGEAERVVDAAVSHFGGLDILIPNAGGPPAGRAIEMSDEQLQAAFSGTFLSASRLVHAALPYLTRSPAGRICCIASVTVVKPIARLSLSNMARGALWAWARDMAADLRTSGVTFNLLCPGPHSGQRSIDVSLLDDVGDPADLGKVAAFLCSAYARNISGAAIVVDGGAAAYFPE